MKKFVYRVIKGDSINEIAKKFNVPQLSIISYNNLSCEISCGDLLVIRIFDYKIYSVNLYESLQNVLEKVKDKNMFYAVNGNVKYLYYGMQVYLT